MYHAFSQYLRRPLATLMLMVMPTSCMEWKPISIAPEPFQSGQYRLTLRDGSQFDLFNPRVERDSVVGALRTEQPDGSWTRAVALANVRLIETPHGNTSSEVRWRTFFDGAPTHTEIRLNLQDGSQIRLYDPVFLGDSIQGKIRTRSNSDGVSTVVWREGVSRIVVSESTWTPTTVSLADVAKVEAKKVNWKVVGPLLFNLALIVGIGIACEVEDGPCGWYTGPS